MGVLFYKTFKRYINQYITIQYRKMKVSLTLGLLATSPTIESAKAVRAPSKRAQKNQEFLETWFSKNCKTNEGDGEDAVRPDRRNRKFYRYMNEWDKLQASFDKCGFLMKMLKTGARDQLEDVDVMTRTETMMMSTMKMKQCLTLTGMVMTLMGIMPMLLMDQHLKLMTIGNTSLLMLMIMPMLLAPRAVLRTRTIVPSVRLPI